MVALLEGKVESFVDTVTSDLPVEKVVEQFQRRLQYGHQHHTIVRFETANHGQISIQPSRLIADTEYKLVVTGSPVHYDGTLRDISEIRLRLCRSGAWDVQGLRPPR